jgi:hypothetical protein
MKYFFGAKIKGVQIVGIQFIKDIGFLNWTATIGIFWDNKPLAGLIVNKVATKAISLDFALFGSPLFSADASQENV